MKFLILLNCFILFLNIAQAQESGSDSIPALNKEIITFVNQHLKKKVGRGECWDLAAEALNTAGAKWNGRYVYGKALDPEKDTIYPGDIIQFEGVKIKYNKNNQQVTEKMMHHTAVVYRVLGHGDYELAHQNTDFSKRKVGISELNTKYVVKGKMFFYRPTR